MWAWTGDVVVVVSLLYNNFICLAVLSSGYRRMCRIAGAFGSYWALDLMGAPSTGHGL